MSISRFIGASVVGAVAWMPLGAQQWHTVDLSRALRDTSPLTVAANFGAGKLTVRPTSDSSMFTMHLRYDGEVTTPSHSYDAAQHRLVVGIKDATVKLPSHASMDGEMKLGLTTRVPIDLSLTLGAGTADVDLGGLALAHARIESGASGGSITFSRPNRAVMSRLEVEAGAADLSVTGLANAGAKSIHADFGMGELDLGFDGEWSHDIDLTLEGAVSKIVITVPDDVGVMSLAMTKFSHFDRGAVRADPAGDRTANFASAKYHLTIRGNATLSIVTIKSTNQ